MFDRDAGSRFPGCKRRDLEALIEQYHPLVRSVCRRYLRDPNDVEDAVQETLVKFVQRRGEIEGSVLAWLSAVAHSTSMDLIRSAIGQRNRRAGISRSRPADARDRVAREAIRLKLSHIHPHERVLPYLSVGPSDYFLNLLRWLAEPNRQIEQT